MSRIGKKPIQILDGVEVDIKDRDVKIKGPKGELGFEIPEEIKVEKKDSQVIVSEKRKTKQSPALWGLTRALLQNNIIGVCKGFEKRLEIHGVGYRASIKGDKTLVLEIGFSHSVEIEIPSGLKVAVEKNIIIISGIDKQKVGQIAAQIRKNRPPEPYKGKGIRYVGEKVRRKEGKKAGGTTT